MILKLENSFPSSHGMLAKLEGARTEAPHDQEEEDEEEEEEEDREEDEEEEAPLLQQTLAYIRTYTKYGYRFMQLTEEAYKLKDDPEIMGMLEQQQLTGLLHTIPCKIDEERCAEFMRTFNFFTKTGTVTGLLGEECQVMICADLISRTLHIPNRGRETQLKNTSKYFKHVVAPGYRATCDGVKFEDIIDPHVQRKARFLQMLTVCTYRNRHCRILKTNLARICAPNEQHNWAALIATDLAAGCRNLNNRNCVCGSILTRVIHTQLGIASEPYIDATPLAQMSLSKSSPELFLQVPKRKLAFMADDNYEKMQQVRRESDFQARKVIMETGPEGEASKALTVSKELCVVECRSPPIRPKLVAVEHSSSLSEKNEMQATAQATRSSSTLSIRSGDVIVKDTLTTGESQRMVTKEPSSDQEEYYQHLEMMDNGPSSSSHGGIPKCQDLMSCMAMKVGRAKAPNGVLDLGVLKSNYAAKLSKTSELGSMSFIAEEGKFLEPALIPSHLLQETIQEGTGSSQEKKTSFCAGFPWCPADHICQNLLHGAEKALWDQSFALMTRLQAAQEADQQRLEEAEQHAQSSMQHSFNLEQAYQALELQMKIQKTQFEGLELQHSKLLKDFTVLKERASECNLQVHCAQAERDKVLKSLKVKEAHIQVLEKELRRLDGAADQELNFTSLNARHALELDKKAEKHEGKTAQLQAKLDAALLELGARKLELKEVRGDNAKLRDQMAQLEAALQEKVFDLNSFRSDAEALLPDIEKLTKKYKTYKRSRQTSEW